MIDGEKRFLGYVGLCYLGVIEAILCLFVLVKVFYFDECFVGWLKSIYIYGFFFGIFVSFFWVGRGFVDVFFLVYILEYVVIIRIVFGLGF